MREPDYSILSKLTYHLKPRRNTKRLTGQRFGHLTAFGYVGSNNCHTYWLCRCDCGGFIITRANSLRQGSTKTCGCYMDSNRSVGKGNFRTHGMSGTMIYIRWADMHTRCYNPNFKQYADWGGRGIIVEEPWHKFENFYADMGDPPTPQHQINRVNNDGNYGPDNCVWDTKLNQARNTRSNIILTLDGVSHCISEWAEVLGIPASRIYQRHHRGLSDSESLNRGKL